MESNFAKNAVKCNSDDFWKTVDVFGDQVDPEDYLSTATEENHSVKEENTQPTDDRKRKSNKVSSAKTSVDSNQHKKRRLSNVLVSNGLKKTLIAPKVVPSLKVKKYPGDFKQIFDTTLQKNGVSFDIPLTVRTIMVRPATKDLGKYWYTLWQYIFTYISLFPQYTLSRCIPHITKLLNAQRVAMENFETMGFDRNPLSGPGSLAFNASTFGAAAFNSSTVGTLKNTTTDKSISGDALLKQVSLEEYRDLFSIAAKSFDYQVDPCILALVQTERAKMELTEHLQIFECYWIYICAIVERVGEMFLKRSCLNGNIMQIVRANAVFSRFSSQRNIKSELTCNDVDPTKFAPNDFISVVREDIRKAFEALRAREIKLE